jgi:hypothetical protein
VSVLDECYEMSKDINLKYNCPPLIKDYTGQFQDILDIYKKCGHALYTKGNVWFYKNYAVQYIGFRFDKYWPIYEYTLFARFLKGVV